jgi:hypothetical protein
MGKMEKMPLRTTKTIIIIIITTTMVTIAFRARKSIQKLQKQTWSILSDRKSSPL